MIFEVFKRSRGLEAQFEDARCRFGLVTRQSELQRSPPAIEAASGSTLLRSYAQAFSISPSSPGLPPDENAQDLLEDRDCYLDPLREAKVLDLRADYDLGWNQEFGEATVAKRACDTLAAQMFAHASQGNWDKVILKAATIEHLSHMLRCEPVFLFLMIGLSARKKLVSTTVRIANEFRPPNEVLSSLARHAISGPFEFNIHELVRHDLYYSLVLSRNEKGEDSTVFEGLPASLLMRAGLSEYIEAWSEMATIFTSKLTHSQIANQGLLISASLRKTIVHYRYVDNRNIWGQFCVAVANDEALRRAAVVALQRLVPNSGLHLLVNSLDDPYTNKPMLTRTNESKICIYSAGLNRLDDCGPRDGTKNVGSDDIGVFLRL